MKKKLTFLLALAFGPVLLMPVNATTMIKMSEGQMARQAEAIVLGQATAARTEWVGGTLITLIDINVAESLKGASSAEITVAIPGGIDATGKIPVAVTFPGAPTIFANEDLLLFLAGSSAVSGAYDVVGFSQGKYSVVETEPGKKVVAQGRFNGKNGKALGIMKKAIREALED